MCALRYHTPQLNDVLVCSSDNTVIHTELIFFDGGRGHVSSLFFFTVQLIIFSNINS